MRAMIEELRKSMKKIKDIEGELVVFQSEYKKTILELKRKNSVKFLRLR